MLRCFISFLMQGWCNKTTHLFNDFMTNLPFCPSLPFHTSDLWELLLSPSVTRGAEEHGSAERDRPLSHPFPHVRGCWSEGRLLGAHLCGWTLHPSLLFPLPHHSRHQRFAGWLKKNFNVNVQDLTCGMKYDENIETLKDLHVWRLEAMWHGWYTVSVLVFCFFLFL